MKNYFPYKSDKPEKKYYIITKDNKRVYFGAEGYYDYTLYYKKYGKELANDKKEAYVKRHSKNESKFWDKSGLDTPSFWALFLLWNKPTIKSSYEDIKKRFLT
jgi:hypothetical protein